MEIRKLIITLDQMCRNSRGLASAQGMDVAYLEEAEAGELALNLLRALQLAGANTTAEALALLRAFPETAKKCSALEHELVQAKKHISDLCTKNRMQALMLDASRALLEMPGMPREIANACAKDPAGGIKAFSTALEKMQNTVPFLAKEAAQVTEARNEPFQMENDQPIQDWRMAGR